MRWRAFIVLLLIVLTAIILDAQVRESFVARYTIRRVESFDFRDATYWELRSPRLRESQGGVLLSIEKGSDPELVRFLEDYAGQNAIVTIEVTR